MANPEQEDVFEGAGDMNPDPKYAGQLWAEEKIALLKTDTQEVIVYLPE